MKKLEQRMRKLLMASGLGTKCDWIDRPREGGFMPRKPGEKDRGIGKKVCEWRFNPNKLYNPLIILFLLIYECV